MRKWLWGIFVLTTFLVADEQPPVFLPIESTEDFYSGSNIFLEVQATDESSIEDILLYYRFSKEDPFTSVMMDKEMFYVGEIPESEVRPGKLEYYFFARDEFGNQSTWPENGEDSPESYPVFEPLFSGVSHGDILIDLLNPLADEVSEEASIIILSLYDPEESLNLDDIRLFIDDEDVSELIFRSTDMLTYVPRNSLNPGKHIIEVKLVDDGGEYLSKKFKFTLAEINLSAIEKVDFRKKFKFKGNISYNSDFDEFFGNDRPENRPLDSHKLNVSAKFTIGDFKVKSSVLMNTHLIDETARLALDRRQPSNRLKFGLSSPFLDFKYGDFSTEFSEFTLKGTRVRGVYSRLKLGPWKTSIIFGNTKEIINPIVEENKDSISWTQIVDSTLAIIDTLYINHTKGTASRKMDAFRTELDFSKFNFGINALRSYDDIEQYGLDYEELYEKYTFLGNAVISMDFTLRLNNKKTQFKGETAISLMNDLRGNSVKTYADNFGVDSLQLNAITELINTIEDVVGFNINGDVLFDKGSGRGISIPTPKMDSLNTNDAILDYMANKMFKKGTYRFLFKTPIELEKNTFDFQAEYKRVPANFNSLGNASIQTDIQGLKSSIKGRLFKNIFLFSLGYNNEHDNLMPEDKIKLSTTTSIITSGGLGINYLNYPSIHYTLRVMDREGISTITNVWDENEDFTDGNGIWDEGEDFIDSSDSENGIWDEGEAFTDSLNGIYDEGEAFTDKNQITVSNRTITHTISPSYKFDTQNDINVSIGGNIMMMDYNDNLYDPSNETAINVNFTTNSYIGSLGLRFDSPLSLNMGGGLSVNFLEDTAAKSTEFLVLTSKLGYKFMAKTLSTYLGLNFVAGSKEEDAEGNGAIDNLKITIKSGAQYKFATNMSIGLNIDFISLSDNIIPSNDFSELRGKLKFKMSF